MTDVVSKKLPGLVKCPNRLISLSNRLIFRVCVCVCVCVCVHPGSDGKVEGMDRGGTIQISSTIGA